MATQFHRAARKRVSHILKPAKLIKKQSNRFTKQWARDHKGYVYAETSYTNTVEFDGFTGALTTRQDSEGAVHHELSMDMVFAFPISNMPLDPKSGLYLFK